MIERNGTLFRDEDGCESLALGAVAWLCLLLLFVGCVGYAVAVAP